MRNLADVELIKTIEDILAELKKRIGAPVETTRTVATITVSETDQRKFTVELSKKLTEELQHSSIRNVPVCHTPGARARYEPREDTVKFIVKRDERLVIALIQFTDDSNTSVTWAKGIAKCNPDDVFNEHVGKAIALHRALGKNVPQALINIPQPKEFCPGQLIGFNKVEIDTIYKILTIDQHVQQNLKIVKCKGYPELVSTSASGGNFNWAKILDDSEV